MADESVQEKPKGFFTRMLSEDPTASSQRIIGTSAFVVAVVFVLLKFPEFKEFLYFCALMFGIKEGRKGIDSIASAIGAKKEDSTKTPTDKKDDSKATPAKS